MYLGSVQAFCDYYVDHEKNIELLPRTGGMHISSRHTDMSLRLEHWSV